MEIREVTYIAIVLRIFAAVIVGGIIGLERELKNRAAGLRTYMLVCVGACLIMLTNQYIFQVFGIGDPVRMGAQVVSGIGFLGAGTIIVTRRSQIKGLTTAAGLWTAAGVGLALGIGLYEIALVAAVAVVLIMTLMQRLDDWMRKKTRRLDVYIEIAEDVSLGEFLREIRGAGFEASDIQKESVAVGKSEIRGYTLTMKVNKRRKHTLFLEDIENLPHVVYVEEL